MSPLKLRKWDTAEHLRTEEDMALYLEACLQEAGDDAAFVARALGHIARAKGMSQLARDTGLGRESLYNGRGGPGLYSVILEGLERGLLRTASPFRAKSRSSRSSVSPPRRHVPDQDLPSRAVREAVPGPRRPRRRRSSGARSRGS